MQLRFRMDSTTAILASGLRARAESLDVVANNLANVATPAFKAELEQYRQYASDEAIAGNQGIEFSPLSPELRQSWINFTQGGLEKTDRPMDLALDGQGFFIAENSQERLLTRNGSFQLGTDGLIRTKEGFKVKLLLPDGRPLPEGFKLDPQKQTAIDRQGIIRQENVAVARFDLAIPDSLTDLNKAGASYFAIRDSAKLKQSTSATLHQGWIEQSNFDPTAGSIQLINISRQFEMLQKALQLQGDMGRRSTEEVGRV